MFFEMIIIKIKLTLAPRRPVAPAGPAGPDAP